MIKALAIKELRESAGLVVLAALGMAWVIARCMGVNPLETFVAGTYSSHHLALVQDDFYSMACLFVGGLAVFLGLKQSAWELNHNTFHFLFHRPLSRQSILNTKLLIGSILVFGVLAIAILVYGIWAATPGNLAAPFEWSMTRDAWLLAVGLPLVYLGAFLSGLRPGRWFGTRLAPLVAVIALVAFYSEAIFWWLQLIVLLVGYVMSVVSIHHYTSTRDY
jgi:hypothetical protein